MIEIIWSPQAIEDLESIRRFIARDSAYYAELVVESIVSSVERLASFPESGRLVPEIGSPNLREVLWRDYRVVYRLHESSVEIATVFHGSMPLRDHTAG